MQRRAFITLLGGAAVAWPLAARAQQAAIRRIGVLMNLGEADPEDQTRVSAFVQALSELGWRDGREVRIDIRWGGDDTSVYGKEAAELVALAPDVILASGSTSVRPLQQATHTVPIVFANTSDPVGAGFVESLAHPGGNITGFMSSEYGMSEKSLELLKEISPTVTQVGVIQDPTMGSRSGRFTFIQSATASLKLDVTAMNVRDAGEIERAIAEFARGANGGLIVTSGGVVGVHRDLIIVLAARHRLPTVYPYRYYVASGGLVSYGPNTVDPFRRAAGYVDRILKGERAADLPVQVPTKYELVINVKTAKALGLEVPAALLARADEVIE